MAAAKPALSTSTPLSRQTSADQIEREAVGVVQLEGHFAGQHFDAASQGFVQDLHAGGQGLEEALFFHAQHFGNARPLATPCSGRQHP